MLEIRDADCVCSISLPPGGLFFTALFSKFKMKKTSNFIRLSAEWKLWKVGIWWLFACLPAGMRGPASRPLIAVGNPIGSRAIIVISVSCGCFSPRGLASQNKSMKIKIKSGIQSRALLSTLKISVHRTVRQIESYLEPFESWLSRLWTVKISKPYVEPV